ncbi:MAG: phosphotransferase [bacterium]|nr:phosphotransferase [bacterium]
MNYYANICRCIFEKPESTQREIAQEIHSSLGTANRLIHECEEQLLITPSSFGVQRRLLPKGEELLQACQVDGALIIAAGFGSRFVPLTFETPKGLLEVFGERMVERQIKQLHANGIRNITIVVGYLKEKFEYLIDKYQVSLLYNPEYTCKNTLATLYHAREILRGKNMYVLSSDNWMRDNMYHSHEPEAWYSSVYQSGPTSEWCLTFNKKEQITDVQIGGNDSWVMYGPVYFSREFSEVFLPELERYYHRPGTEQFYWEQVLMDMIKQKKINMQINRQPDTQVYEFENLEELRRFDSKYQNHSDNTALQLISKVFQLPESEISDIRCLKSGMTNQSFLFQIQGKHYICRIPGSGTAALVNRKEEKAVYEAVTPLGITEHLIYFDSETGYKISVYYEGSRNALPHNTEDLSKCMALLRTIHNAPIQVAHRFDLRNRIQFYEDLCRQHNCLLFEDYEEVRSHMNTLLDFLEQRDRPQTLAHIDSNVDNFLFLPNGEVKLIDWEYAGMCDPLIDIAMCSIYSYYTEDEMLALLKLYLQRDPNLEESCVLYAYAALGGFLWSLWAVYKSAVGQEFGDYTIKMYRYAKTSYRRLCELHTLSTP